MSPLDSSAVPVSRRVSLEALRSSMEKGALVLRAIAELCVDKAVFTPEEMKTRAK